MMILMSVAKDAERIGDYAKNLFALTANRTAPSGTAHHDNLQKLREQVLADTLRVGASDQGAARRIERVATLVDHPLQVACHLRDPGSACGALEPVEHGVSP
jgi:hypothetical protein